MPTDFQTSETKTNLMRAFAGESQARNRYDFAAKTAGQQKLYVVEAAFRFTASQEHAHAKVFYNHLKELNGTDIVADGDYPVNITSSVAELLRFAAANEKKEHDEVYKAFGETAKREGFHKVATDFFNIAAIEQVHSERFARFAELLESGKLFVADAECAWICLNCGHVQTTKAAPEVCPVCAHDRGFFIRLAMSPWGVER